MLLLAATGFLYLCEQFHWFGFYERKGWTVLLALAGVGVFSLLMLIWLLLALFFRWQFQFSIRLLLVLAVAVALTFGWLKVEMKEAKTQEEAVSALMKAGCTVWYDCDHQKFVQFWMSPVRVPTNPSRVAMADAAIRQGLLPLCRPGRLYARTRFTTAGCFLGC